MESVLSDAVSLASGGCQLDLLSCEKTASSADTRPTFSVESESPGAGQRNVGSSVNEPCAEASNTLTDGGEWHDKNQISLAEPGERSFETLSRKEKRTNLKKLRRKQIRQEAAEKERLEEIARSQDPAEQLRIQEEEKLEAERLDKERLEHEEQERLFQEREKKAQEEFERKQAELLKKEQERKLQQDEEENWRYVEDDGPAEIIWQGNEIIVRKKRVKVPLAQAQEQPIRNADQPTSNPLPPQSTAFAAYKFPPPATPDVGEENPIFGTEQDKTHCPFHIKTGVCRFGTRCSRVHVYPDQSFTLLIRNMYTGPGLSWDHDEGLESLTVIRFSKEGGKLFWRPDDRNGISASHSDEEVAEQYEEFYEDVHSEFLQFGELVNFKVSKNGSSHLRGNVYVHYQTEAGAQAAYKAMNGRFYAGKQITCEFVGVTRWRVALCGEYMKGHHRPCSHGSACNFLHCFRNPRGEYDWADWDSPPPRYWVVKMAKLFGYVQDHREDDISYHDKSRKRHRSPERARSSERRHRSKDRYSRVDDSEHWSHRARRRHRSGGESYQSSSDDSESSSRHERSRRLQRSSPGSVGDGSRRRSYGDLHEKDRRYHRDSVHNPDTSQDEGGSVGGDELKRTDRARNYGRDHEVDADDLHRPSRRRRNRGTTPEEDHHKHESTSRFSTKSRSRDVQIHDYRLSNGHKSRKDGSSSGSPEKDDEFVKQASETEDGSGSKRRKREPAERQGSLSRRGSNRSRRRSVEGDSSDAETDRTQKTSKSESKRDSRRILRGEKSRHELIDSKLVVHEDRWRPDVYIYQ